MGCLGRRTAAASAARPAWRTRGVLKWGTSISSCISRTNPHEKLRAAFVPPGESPDGLPRLQVLRKQQTQTRYPPPAGARLGLAREQPNPAAYSCAGSSSQLRWPRIRGILRSTAARLHTSRAFPAPKRQPGLTATGHAIAASPPSSKRSRHAPGPAPLRRGRPARRREEVDARHHTSHGAC